MPWLRDLILNVSTHMIVKEINSTMENVQAKPKDVRVYCTVDTKYEELEFNGTLLSMLCLVKSVQQTMQTA